MFSRIATTGRRLKGAHHGHRLPRKSTRTRSQGHPRAQDPIPPRIRTRRLRHRRTRRHQRTRSHQILDDALSALVNLEHRGGVGLERNTGDGAGILFQIPHRFFRKEAQKCGKILPQEGDYGVAMLFFPQDECGAPDARRVFEEGCTASGLPLLFWRPVPVDPHDLGATARACMPTIIQAFVGRPEGIEAGDDFERALYLCRRTIEKRADACPALAGKIFDACSMSSRTIVYKGMLVATQMRRFYTDLNDAAVKTAVALVHSRYSTNTTPSWERAHPNRLIIHNGEINTLKGNVNWIRAREPNLYSPIMRQDLERALPIINREGSDSAILDNVLEFLVQNGRPLHVPCRCSYPSHGTRTRRFSPERRAYDAYQSMLMEPWDGPAAIAFTDGRTLGAALDRNGLRPARYYVTRDDRFLLVLRGGDHRGRPREHPRERLLGARRDARGRHDGGQGAYNEELRAEMAKLKPFRDWIAEETLTLDDLAKDVDAGRRVPRLEARTDGPTPPSHQPCAPPSSAAIGTMSKRSCAPWRRTPRCRWPPWASTRPSRVSPSRTARSSTTSISCSRRSPIPPSTPCARPMVTSTILYLGNHGNLLEDCRNTCRLIRLDAPLLDERALPDRGERRPGGVHERAVPCRLPARGRRGRPRTRPRAARRRRRGGGAGRRQHHRALRPCR